MCGTAQQFLSHASFSSPLLHPFLNTIARPSGPNARLRRGALANLRLLPHEQIMNSHSFELAGAHLHALATGALWWPDQQLLCVSDLHLGKSERIARKGGSALPPYETQDTLHRLRKDILATGARQVVCLGDSFDDLGAALALPEDQRTELIALQAGRVWIWIEGNHDPGPTDLGGNYLAELQQGTLVFRHIAQATGHGEISGHYHPKVSLPTRGRRITRPAFLVDGARVVMPAYGTYTGGLDSKTPVLSQLMSPHTVAVMTGRTAVAVPMPR